MKKIILGAIGVLVVIVIIAAASGGQKGTSTTSQPNDQKQESQKQDSSAPKQWTTIIEVKGNANKRTDTFALKGGKTKLTYDVKGGTTIAFAVYVLGEGHSLEKEGGFPEVSLSEPGTDSTFLTKKAGNYYLDVKSANSTWSIKVEEER